MLAGDQQFGAIRVGVSTLLVQNELRARPDRRGGDRLVALVVSTVVAMLLAQWMLRPIHVIQSGLTRLGRGELDVRSTCPAGIPGPGELLRRRQPAAVSGAAPKERPAAATDFASVMDNLEDAMALFSPRGELMFINSSMRRAAPALASTSAPRRRPPAGRSRTHLAERALAGR